MTGRSLSAIRAAAREAALGFDRLSEAEKAAFIIDSLEREVNNGGFAQFFSNASGDHAAAMPTALRAIGENLAPLLRRFVAVRQNDFGPPMPSNPEQFQ